MFKLNVQEILKYEQKCLDGTREDEILTAKEISIKVAR